MRRPRRCAPTAPRHAPGVLPLFLLALLGGARRGSAEVFLRTDALEVGISDSGTLGTFSTAPSGFHADSFQYIVQPTAGALTPATGGIAIIGNPARDGWATSTGTFIMSALPCEGWGIEATNAAAAQTFAETVRPLVAEGAFRATPDLQESSEGTVVSAVWMGEVSESAGKLRILQAFSISENSSHLRIDVVLTNVGTDTLTDVTFTRQIDPKTPEILLDDDIPDATANTLAQVTENTFAAGELYAAVAAAKDPDYKNGTVALGILRRGEASAARATHLAFVGDLPTLDASAAYVSAGSPPADAQGNHALYAATRVATLEGGSSAAFSLTYSAVAALEDATAGDLAAMACAEIVHPADVVSGEDALVYLTANGSAFAGHTAAVTLIDATGRAHALGNATVALDGASGLHTAHARVNVTAAPEGLAHLRVELVDGSGGVGCRRDRALYVAHATTVAFSASDMDGEYPLYQFASNNLTVVTSGADEAALDHVSFHVLYEHNETREVSMLAQNRDSIGLSLAPGAANETRRSWDGQVEVTSVPVGSRVVVVARTGVSAEPFAMHHTAAFFARVFELNIAPTVALSNAYIDETTEAGAVVGVLSANDVNSGQTHTFTLVDDALGLFAIANGADLVVAAGIDHESIVAGYGSGNVTVRVRVDDGQLLDCCSETDFVIEVGDVNDPPSGISPAQVDIAEDTLPGSVVAVLAAVDDDAEDAHTWADISNQTTFFLHPSTGEVTLLRTLDFETTSAYTIALRVTDDGSPSKYLDTSFSVRVTDVNEPATACFASCAAPYSANVSDPLFGGQGCAFDENLGANTTILTLSASDQDAGQNHTFSLVENYDLGGGLAIVSNNELVISSALVDFEQLVSSTQEVRVRVHDSGTPQQYYDCPLTITVNDLEELPSGSGTSCVVDEALPLGVPVSSTSSDDDSCGVIGIPAASYADVEYRIVAASDRQGTAIADVPIEIHSCSGIFFVNGTIDYETDAFYNITVAIQSTIAPFLEINVSAILTVVDINEQPTFTTLSGFDVVENAPNGTVVGQPLSSVIFDPDSNASQPFCCELSVSIDSGNEAGIFRLDAERNNSILVAKPSLINYETQSSYSLRVTVQDAGGLSASSTLVIGVIDVNEAPVISGPASPAVTFGEVQETAAEGTAVGPPFSATDDDLRQVIACSIVSGDPRGAFALEQSMDIDAGRVDLQLSVGNASVLDYETFAASYSLNVTCADNGTDSLSDSVLLSVAVVDVNEAPTCTAPEIVVEAPESSSAGAVLAVLSALCSDDDAGDTVTYTFAQTVGGSSPFPLVADPSSGNVSIGANGLDFETTLAYAFTVTLEDAEGLAFELALNVTVIDVNEPPTWSSSFVGASLFLAEDAAANATVQQGPSDGSFGFSFELVAEDPEGADLNYSLASASPLPFAIQASGVSTGLVIVLQNASAVDYELQTFYSLSVNATDGTFTTPLPLTIHVVDRNEAPYFASVTCVMDVAVAAGDTACRFLAEDPDFPSGPFGQLTASQAAPPAVTFANGTLRSLSTDAFAVASDAAPQLFSVTVQALPSGITVGSNITLAMNVTDGGGLSFVGNVSVQVAGEDPTPRCPAAALNFSVAENATESHRLGTVIDSLGSDAAAVTNATGGDLLTGRIASGGTYVDLDGVVRQPFVIENVGGQGALVVDDLLDFEAAQSFVLAVKVEGLFASTYCEVSVLVEDVNEPPAMSDLTVSADENIPAGQRLSVGGVASPAAAAEDEDSGDQDPVYAIYPADHDAASVPIQINASSGVLRARDDGLNALDYETRSSYSFVWSRTSRGVQTNATLTLLVVDIAEAPIIHVPSGGYDAAEGTSLTEEILTVNVTDPDMPDVEPCDDSCALRYSIVGSSAYRIDETSGAIFRDREVDFEAAAGHEVTVKVTDDAGLGLATTATLTINTVDVNDVSIVSIVAEDPIATNAALAEQMRAYSGSPNYTLEDAGLNLTGTPAVGTYLPITSSTAGGAVVSVDGRSFGPTPDRVLSDSLEGATNVTLRFGDQRGTARRVAENCTVLSGGNTAVTCRLPEGSGRIDAWSITVVTAYGGGYTANWTSSDSAVPQSSYAAPTVTASSGVSGVATGGGASAVLEGTNFGPAGTAGELTFVANYIGAGGVAQAEEKAAPCAVTDAHSSMECTLPSGIGTASSWRVAVDGIYSLPFEIAGSGYGAPAVSSLSGALAFDTSGSGADAVTISGSNFGEDVDLIAVTFGATGVEYAAVNCTLAVAHSELACLVGPGIGANHSWIVTVGGHSSSPSATTTSFRAPEVGALSGAGTVDASTKGGQDVVLIGTNFGEVGTAVSVTYASAQYVYTAVDCAVEVAHLQVRCATAPGTGRDHVWSIVVGGQASPGHASATAYAAPVITSLEGPGASDAETVGGEAVTILGENFGPHLGNGSIDAVSYATGPNDTSFVVTSSCSVTEAHTTILCSTAPGAGGNLRWTLAIDGVESATPTTDYAMPVVASLDGDGSAGASVYGNESVTLRGANFGFADAGLIDTVTYGATGVELTATGCATVSHDEIVCKTAEGTGSGLFWQVTVAGQTSALSAAARSAYASPALLSILPAADDTSGGVRATLRGTNLALFDGPTLLFGGAPVSYSIESVAAGNGSGAAYDEVAFQVPEGDGGDVDIEWRSPTGAYSAVLSTFSYNPPSIQRIYSVSAGAAATNATTRRRLSEEYLIIVVGSSLGTSPTVEIASENATEAATVEVLSATHTQITLRTTVFSGSVQVTVGNVTSAPFGYTYGEPRILVASIVDTLGLPSGTLATVGGDVLSLTGQYWGLQAANISITVGGLPCTPLTTTFQYYEAAGDAAAIASLTAGVPDDLFDAGSDVQQISCVTPRGQGVLASAVVTVGESSSIPCECASRASCDRPQCVDFSPPSVARVDAPSGNTQGGYAMTIVGSNFGENATATLAGRNLTITDAGDSHAFIVATVPEGAGADIAVAVTVAGQSSAAAAAATFSYDPPAFDTTALGSTSFPTAGAVERALHGENFGPSSSPLQITLGDAAFNVTEHNHTWCKVAVPPGRGTDIPIRLRAGAGLAERVVPQLRAAEHRARRAGGGGVAHRRRDADQHLRVELWAAGQWKRPRHRLRREPARCRAGGQRRRHRGRGRLGGVHPQLDA